MGIESGAWIWVFEIAAIVPMFCRGRMPIVCRMSPVQRGATCGL